MRWANSASTLVVAAMLCALGCGSDNDNRNTTGDGGSAGASGDGTSGSLAGAGGSPEGTGGTAPSTGGSSNDPGGAAGDASGGAAPSTGGSSNDPGGAAGDASGGTAPSTGGSASDLGGAAGDASGGTAPSTGGSSSDLGGAAGDTSGGAAGSASGGAPPETGGSSGSAGAATEPSLYAGVRSSSYGPEGAFPTAERWEEMATAFASRFPNTAPAVVWIVGVIGDDGDCNLEFPSPGGDFANVGFADEDKHEAYLSYFDTTGVKVWLQVEPGDAAVSTLIELVLDRYGRHPSVIGFGVDGEWYKDSLYPGVGKPITDEEAVEWVSQVQSYDPSDTLFVKHWLQDQLPPTERDGLLFINDSQGVAMDDLVDEFADWGEHFAPAPVGFQVGYEADRGWWSLLDDPPGDLGQAILDAVPNTRGLFWVDFTMHLVF